MSGNLAYTYTTKVYRLSCECEVHFRTSAKVGETVTCVRHGWAMIRQAVTGRGQRRNL